MVLNIYLQFPQRIKALIKFSILYQTTNVFLAHMDSSMKQNHQSIKSEDIIKKTKLNKKIIGIGERTDFYYNHSDKKDQIKCFEEHIAAAQRTQLPLIIHTGMLKLKLLKYLKKLSIRILQS